MRTTTAFRTGAVTGLCVVALGLGGQAGTTPVHAQAVCPGNAFDYFTRAVKTGLTGVTGGKTDVIWSDDAVQDIVLNGTDAGNTRAGLALVAGEGSDVKFPGPTWRLEVGLGIFKNPQGNLERGLYAVCVGACQNSGQAEYIANGWDFGETIIVGITRPSSSSGSYYEWIAQFAMKDQDGLHNRGAIRINVSSSYPTANRVAALGAMQRDTGQTCTNCFPNSIGHVKLNRVQYKDTGLCWYCYIGSVTPVVDNGYWMKNCSGNSNYQTGTNESCAYVGDGLAENCY